MGSYRDNYQHYACRFLVEHRVAQIELEIMLVMIQASTLLQSPDIREPFLPSRVPMSAPCAYNPPLASSLNLFPQALHPDLHTFLPRTPNQQFEPQPLSKSFHGRSASSTLAPTMWMLVGVCLDVSGASSSKQTRNLKTNPL